MVQVFLSASAQMAKLVILIGIGWILSKKNILRDEFVSGLISLVINCCAPLMVFSSLQMPISNHLIKTGAQVISFFLLSNVIAYILARHGLKYVKCSNDIKSDWLFLSIFSNVSFIGLPIVLTLFEGADALFYACCIIVASNAFLQHAENLCIVTLQDRPLKHCK